ncbi:ABC transporter permease [Nocardioides sp. SR21]|uniref:ABC transporter permease n=1 Tax=Nocardioides sp. SR21 TaxID=2919501 RepID=UPI001FAAF066|nr:ABC transporter permease [Nocardioides sp. SR21]
MSSVLERPPAAPPADAPPSRVQRVVANKRMLVVTTVLAVLLVYGMVTTDGFATVDNGRAILAAIAITGFGALGATLVMLGGNLFSMSASVTAAGAAMVFLAALQYGVVVALVAALLAGAGAYALQGFAIGAWGANPIVVTIGAGSLQAAVAIMITDGSSVRVAPEVTSYKFLADTVLGIPVGVYLLLVVAALLHLLLTRTVWGRNLYFLGKSPPAAYAAGLPVVLTTVIAFAIAGACTGFAGVVQAASTQSATINDLGTLTFDAVAAAVVGGNAIAGGRGSIPRTLLGVLVIATLGDLLLLRDYSAGVRLLATGLLVIVFVFATSSKEQAR